MYHQNPYNCRGFPRLSLPSSTVRLKCICWVFLRSFLTFMVLEGRKRTVPYPLNLVVYRRHFRLCSCAGRGATEQRIHLKPRAWPPTTSCLAGVEDGTRIISFTSAVAGFSTDGLLRNSVKFRALESEGDRSLLGGGCSNTSIWKA